MEITPDTILLVIVIVFALVNLVQTILVQRSIPLDKVSELVAELSKAANTTTSPLDNRAVELLEKLLAWYAQDRQPTPIEEPTVSVPASIITVTNNTAPQS